MIDKVMTMMMSMMVMVMVMVMMMMMMMHCHESWHRKARPTNGEAIASMLDLKAMEQS